MKKHPHTLTGFLCLLYPFVHVAIFLLSLLLADVTEASSGICDVFLQLRSFIC